MVLTLGSIEALSISDAAHAVDVPARTFRLWSERLPLMVPRREPGAWLRVAPVDVTRLAIAGQIVRYGFTFAEAAEILAIAVDSHLAGVVAAIGDMPFHFVQTRLLGLTLSISREPLGIAVSSRNLTGSRAAHHTGATLEIDAWKIAQDVYRRARQRGAE